MRLLFTILFYFNVKNVLVKFARASEINEKDFGEKDFDEKDFDEISDWFRQEMKGKISEKVVMGRGAVGRGMFAKEHVKFGEILLYIPTSQIITLDTVFEHGFSPDDFTLNEGGEKLSCRQILALFIILEGTFSYR